MDAIDAARARARPTGHGAVCLRIDGIRIIGPAAGVDRSGLASFDRRRRAPHDVGQVLDLQGLAYGWGTTAPGRCTAGSACTATTRAIVSVHTTAAEVDQMIEAVAGVRAYFGVQS